MCRTTSRRGTTTEPGLGSCLCKDVRAGCWSCAQAPEQSDSKPIDPEMGATSGWLRLTCGGNRDQTMVNIVAGDSRSCVSRRQSDGGRSLPGSTRVTPGRRLGGTSGLGLLVALVFCWMHDANGIVVEKKIFVPKVLPLPSARDGRRRVRCCHVPIPRGTVACKSHGHLKK